MSFNHYLFLGHFEHDGDVLRFSKCSTDAVYRPVIRQPIDVAAIKAVQGKVNGPEENQLNFPDDWMIWPRNGYLVCEKYTTNLEAINFIARLVERTRCDIYDVAAHRDITLREWQAAIGASLARPV